MLRALLVDDEEIARRGLRIRLERAGDIEIVGECQNGKEAVTAIERLVPDVVFLDIQMPEMSGMDIARSLPSSRSARPRSSRPRYRPSIRCRSCCFRCLLASSPIAAAASRS